MSLRKRNDMGVNDPYFRPQMELAEGEAVYQRFTFCPYCGEYKHHLIKQIQGAWFWLRCRSCGRDYKVRSKAK